MKDIESNTMDASAKFMDTIFLEAEKENLDKEDVLELTIRTIASLSISFTHRIAVSSGLSSGDELTEGQLEASKWLLKSAAQAIEENNDKYLVKNYKTKDLRK